MTWAPMSLEGLSSTGLKSVCGARPAASACKACARVIDTLMRSGNAWFIRKDGKVILMAENIKENASALTRFKRAERQRTGAKSIKRGQEIPIAVLVPRVTLKRRFDFDGTVRRAMPQLAQSINRYLNRN